MVVVTAYVPDGFGWRIMCIATSKGNRGLSWSENKDLEDVDFADDLALHHTRTSPEASVEILAKVIFNKRIDNFSDLTRNGISNNSHFRTL